MGKLGKWGEQNDGTYRNPIIPADYSDIDCIQVGDDYYAISSTFQFSPGMTLLHSKDLVNWEFCGNIISDLTQIGTKLNWDQMDRYGEIYTTYQMILDAIHKVPTATVLLNGDSPLFNSQTLSNPIQYYGFDTDKSEPQLAHYNTEGILCPHCHNILKYKLNTYANLGDYICEHCGFHRPSLTYAVSDLLSLTQRSSQFRIQGQDYHINIGGLYNIYNALAAVAIARYLGADSQLIKQGFDKSRAVFGRQETFHIGDKECTSFDLKSSWCNPAIEMIKLAPYPFSLSVLLNA